MMERLAKDKVESDSSYLSVPRKIDTPYPFIAIADVGEMVERFIPNINNGRVSDDFQKELFLIQRKYAPDSSTFYTIEQRDLINKTEMLVEKKIIEEVRDGSCIGVVNLDRYILKDSIDINVFKLNISRGSSGDLVARPGSNMTKDEQFLAMENWLIRGGYDSLILVDDVVAFSETLGVLVQQLRSLNPKIKISVVSGICSTGGIWSGKEKLNRIGVDVLSDVLVSASPSIDGGSTGMAIPDSRDFTIFGGKIGVDVRKRFVSFPYFYPFSKPLNSFYRNGSEYNASMEILELNQNFISSLENVANRKLTIGDLEKTGFGIPFTSIGELVPRMPVPSSSDSIYGFLDDVKHLFF